MMGVTGNNVNRVAEKKSSVRACLCLMEILLQKLCAEKSENTIDETRAFLCSQELF